MPGTDGMTGFTRGLMGAFWMVGAALAATRATYGATLYAMAATAVTAPATASAGRLTTIATTTTTAMITAAINLSAL